MSRRDHLKKLITNHTRRWQALKERQALYGLEAPVALLTEIEDIEQELAALHDELAALDKTAEPGSPSAAAAPIVSASLETQPITSAHTKPLSFAPDSQTPVRLFISARRQSKRDSALADYLADFLTGQGYEVFLDRERCTDLAWLDTVDRHLKQSHFLIVLLSEATAESELVQAEIRRAFEYRRRQGHPLTLPVRVAYDGLLPYTIDAFLNPLQYATWNGEVDNERVGQTLVAAINGHGPQPSPPPLRPDSKQLFVSEDGRMMSRERVITPPLPNVDLRFLEALEAPGGTVKLKDKFYVEREADGRLKREVSRAGTTTTIRAPYQTGKSSLLVRAVKHAREHGAFPVTLDLQRVDLDHLSLPDNFLRYLADYMVHALRLDPAQVEHFWQSAAGPQDKLTYLLEDYILPQAQGPVVLAMDEVDRLLQTHFHSDFFGLLRAWHNQRALDERWDRLNLVMVISTEPYHLIADPNQSPFNVGLKLYLQDFSEAQVRDLNQRHGRPVRAPEFTDFFGLLNGHPYLTRKALYTLVVKRWAWPDLLRLAIRDDGPFSDHLRRHAAELRHQPALRQGLRQVITEQRCADEEARFRLIRAGLIKQVASEVYTCRCDLYRHYFEDKL